MDANLLLIHLRELKIFILVTMEELMNCFPTKSHLLRLLIVLICSLSFNVQSASLQDQFQNKEKQESLKAVDNHKKFDDLLSSSLEDLFVCTIPMPSNLFMINFSLSI